MNNDSISEQTRYQVIVSKLDTIIRRLDDLEEQVDDVDRTLRPYGDGHKPPRRRS